MKFFKNNTKEKYKYLNKNCDQKIDTTEIYNKEQFRNINTKEKEKLDIYIILKDNEYYCKNILPGIIKELESYLNCRWFIYENNSSDNTKNLLKLLFENLDAKLLLDEKDFDYSLFNKENCQYIESKMYDKKTPIKIGYRCEKISLAREKCKKLCTGIDANWSLLLDTDVLINYKKSIIPLIQSRNTLPNGKMFCSYTTTIVPYPIFKTDNLDNTYNYLGKRYILDYYYDTFAYNFGEHLWNYSFRNIIEKHLGNHKYLKVKSASGGCVLIDSNILHKCKWNTICDDEMKSYDGYKKYGTCEHWNFCKDVNKHGDIYIVKKSKGIWINDRLIKDKQLLKNYIECIFTKENKVLGINTKSEYIDFFF